MVMLLNALETDSLTLANMINGLVEPTWDTRAIIE